jgi:hypothetical protein
MKLYTVKVSKLSNGYKVLDSKLYVIGSVIHGNYTTTAILTGLNRNGFFIEVDDIIIDTEFSLDDPINSLFKRNYERYMFPLIPDIISIDRNNKINSLL